MTVQITRFVRYAGSKTQLLDDIASEMPTLIPGYHEVCLGSGSMLLHLLATNRFTASAVIQASDADEEIANLWIVLSRGPDAVRNVQTQYNQWPSTEEQYNMLRACSFTTARCISESYAAARTLWLNAHCFNGLYRKNKAGDFNTPYAKDQPPHHIDFDVVAAVSAEFARRRVLCERLDAIEVLTDLILHPGLPGSVVYVDPPYAKKKATSFDAYGTGIFGPKQQIALAEKGALLAKRGYTVILSNAFTPEIVELYRKHGYRLKVVYVNRTISCDSSTRGMTPEIIAIGKFNP